MTILKNNKCKKRTHKTACLISWLILLALIAAVIFASLQKTADTKILGERILEWFSDKFIYVYNVEQMTNQEQADAMYLFRQSARVIVFFFLGIIGCIAMRITFPRLSYGVQILINLIILTGFAAFTEIGKEVISDRHYSRPELMISIYAIFAGCIGMTILWSFFQWLLDKHSIKYRNINPVR